MLSRGTSLLAALKTCLETLPTLLPEADSVSLSTFSPIVQPNVASNLLRHLSDVFEILFPLSLSSPTTTLDGLLPCIHAFIRSCGSLASITTSHQNVLSQWNKLGQLLLQTLSSLVKISNSNQDASTNERLLLRKVAGSFLDQASGCKNWKAFTAAYSNVSNLLTAGAATSSAGGKGKGKARDLSNDGQDARSGYETMVGSESMQAYLETLSALLDSFIKVAVFSYANLARWLSASGGASLDTPKQAQESLSELFSTLRASIRPQEASNPSNSSHSTVSVLPVLMDHYIETLSAHSHDLFSPSRRSRNAGDVVNVNVNGSSSTAGSRSAVEYQVQTCFRNAVFGMLQGLTELLKEALPGPAPGKNTSRRKRQRDVSSVDGDVALRRAAATTFRLLLNQIQEKNIYITGGAESNREWLKILEHAARFIVCELLPLSERTEDLDAVTTQAAMQAATSIAKMDNTALEEVLPSLLQTMSKTIPEQQDHFATACHELLDTTVSYKGKVRQLNSYLDTVNKTLSSIIDEAAATSEETSSFVNTMHNMFKAPLLSVRAIAKLSKEARSSLPARQSLPLLKAILGVVQEQALAMQQAREETGTDAKPPKKKTKSGRTSIGGSSVSSIEQERLAWRIHAGIHVIQCILSGNKAATMFGSTSDGLEELQLSMSSIVSQTAHLDIISSANTAEQRIVAAILQLQETWSLFTEKATSLENVTDASLVDVVQSNRALPALRFEIVSDLSPVLCQRCLLIHYSLLTKIRTLLSQAASTNAKMAIAERLCDSIIAVLESASDHKEVPWDGYTHSISEEQLPVGIWWLISSKYIDVIESVASRFDR